MPSKHRSNRVKKSQDGQKMISIICTCNNRTVLNNYLLKGLKNQTENYELIVIEDSKTDFKSAAQALNHGGEKASGDYIIFVHQDVLMESKTWLSDLHKMLMTIENLGAAGIAGKSSESPEVVTNVKHGDNPHFAGKKQIVEPVKVQTLDECLMIVPRKVFEARQFDETTCDGWHLYGVDYCLMMDEMGLDVYVLPMSIIHKSSGDPFAPEYYRILGKLFKKYKKSYSTIHTTVSDWNTRYPVSLEKRRFWLTNKLYSGAKNRVKAVFKN
jgi:hypothetical protein